MTCAVLGLREMSDRLGTNTPDPLPPPDPGSSLVRDMGKVTSTDGGGSMESVREEMLEEGPREKECDGWKDMFSVEGGRG